MNSVSSGICAAWMHSHWPRANASAAAVLNSVPHQGTGGQEAAETIASSFGLQVADPSFGDRVAFSRCMISGQAAQEVEPNGKAAAEVTALFDWVVAQLHTRTRAPAQRKKKGEAA